ncbi:MAG: DUF58 domain-containing protein [Clostridia bacterium]|nr:DUF58 domain-containing protein [Clostridia bacterium]
MKKFVINEELLTSLETLQLYIRNNVAGKFGGNSRTKNYGSSAEFADHRDYMAGDDVTRINWKAYARLDKLYLKLRLDERQMHTRIYIDASRSMEWGEGRKAEMALKLAAALAYISAANMDKVSVYAINGRGLTPIIDGVVGKDAFFGAAMRLNDIVFEGDCFISDAILPTGVGYGDGMSVIISDFLTDNDYERTIDRLASKRRDLLCAQVLDRNEINPQLSGRYSLFDSEELTREYKKNIDADIKAAYRAALEFIKERVRRYAESRGGSYVLVPADADVGEVILNGFMAAEVVK